MNNVATNNFDLSFFLNFKVLLLLLPYRSEKRYSCVSWSVCQEYLHFEVFLIQCSAVSFYVIDYNCERILFHVTGKTKRSCAEIFRIKATSKVDKKGLPHSYFPYCTVTSNQKLLSVGYESSKIIE